MEVKQHFQELYTSDGFISKEDMLSIRGNIPHLLQGNLENLIQPISFLEFRRSVSTLHLDKAPGPDGFSISFYRSCWNIIKMDLVKQIIWTQCIDQIGGSTNSTFLSLIPKEQNPSSIKRYTPISLCNSSYKILSKVISNKLKKEIPLIISKNQGRFIA